MSELISGKEAAQAFINGEQVEFLDKTGQWRTIFDNTVLRVFRDHDDFRIKPRTVNLNGVDVGLLRSTEWDSMYPNRVMVEFKSEGDARHFNNNAMKIFNGV